MFSLPVCVCVCVCSIMHTVAQCLVIIRYIVLWKELVLVAPTVASDTEKWY